MCQHRSLEGALVRAEEAHAAAVTAWQERCHRRSDLLRAEAEVRVPALPRGCLLHLPSCACLELKLVPWLH